MIRAWQLLSASLGLGLVTVWGALLGIFTTPFLIHRLGVSSYGVFALITIVTGYLLNLEFGFGQATVRFLARARASGEPQTEAEVIGSALSVFLPAAIVGGCVLLFGAPFIVRHFAHGPGHLHALFVDAIRLGGPIVFSSFLASFATSALQALGRFQVVVRTRAVFGTAASVSAVVTAAAGLGLRGVLTAQVLVSATQCVVLMWVLSRSTAASLRPSWHRATVRSMARFGFFVLLAGLGTQVMLQGAPTILAAYSTTAEVAAFAVPNLVLQQLLGIVGASSFGFLPFVSAVSARGDLSRVREMYRANLRMTLLIIAPVTVYLAVFARTLLSTWIDPSFAARASGALSLLAVAVVVLGLSAPPADVARGLDRPAVVTLYTAASSVAVLVLAFLAVPRHGAAGAAFALSVGLGTTTAPLVIGVATNLLDMPLRDLARSLTGPALGVGGLAVLYLLGQLISSSFAAAIATGAGGTTLYVIATYKFILDDRERDVLTAVGRQIRQLAARARHRPRLTERRLPS